LREVSHPLGYIKLHPKDAEKYGAPPEIPFDLTAIGVRQRAAVEAAARRSLRWMFDQLAGVPELDEAGNPIPVPVRDGDGNPVMEDDGVTPKVTPRITRHGDAIAMVAWMALWGIGIKVPWDTFDIVESGMVVRAWGDDGDDSEDEPGKADQPETDSESSTTDPS
jgi:hypothetical protein